METSEIIIDNFIDSFDLVVSEISGVKYQSTLTEIHNSNQIIKSLSELNFINIPNNENL